MWTIFKVVIGFVMIPLLFHVLGLWTQGMLYVSSLTRTEPTLPALEGKVPTTGWSEKVAPFSTIALWLCQFRFHHSSYLITLMPPKGSNFCHSPLQFTLQTVARLIFSHFLQRFATDWGWKALISWQNTEGPWFSGSSPALSPTTPLQVSYDLTI